MSGSLEELWIMIPLVVIAVLLAICLVVPVLAHRYCRRECAQPGAMCYECCVCFDAGPGGRGAVRGEQKAYEGQWQNQADYTAGMPMQQQAPYGYMQGAPYGYNMQQVQQPFVMQQQLQHPVQQYYQPNPAYNYRQQNQQNNQRTQQIPAQQIYHHVNTSAS